MFLFPNRKIITVVILVVQCQYLSTLETTTEHLSSPACDKYVSKWLDKITTVKSAAHRGNLKQLSDSAANTVTSAGVSDTSSAGQTDFSSTTVAAPASGTITDTTKDLSGIIQYFRNKSTNIPIPILSSSLPPQIKPSLNISQNLLPLPPGSTAALIKPTKYHYYPHNQHIYLLPECAIQQVCNAVYIRLNWTQPLCACPSRYRDPCSASLNTDDLHTTELITDATTKRALTLVKTCEPTSDIRYCRNSRDWSLLAFQNIRTGKSHYLVICRCPESHILEGPMNHDQPTYANIPGIRIYGMICVNESEKSASSATGPKSEAHRMEKSLSHQIQLVWKKITDLVASSNWDL